MSTQMATASTLFRSSSFDSDFVTVPPDTTDTPPPEEISKPIKLFADLIPLWLNPAQKPFSLDDASTVVRRASRPHFAGQHDQEDRKFVVYATHSQRASDCGWKTGGFGAAAENWISSTFRPGAPLRPAWRPQIEAASTQVEIVALLRLFGLDVIADRLSYLRDLAHDDPEEPQLKIDSLRLMALFTMAERQLPEPRIGVNPDGLAHIEWRLPTNGILAMEFLTSGLIRFAAISAPAQPNVDRKHVSGTLPKGEALEAVKPFTKQLSVK